MYAPFTCARGPLLSVVFAACVASVACNGSGSSPADEPTDTANASLDGPSGTLEGSVECTFAYRPSNEVGPGQTGNGPAFQLEERTLAVAVDEDASERLGQLTFSVGFHAYESETDSINVSVSADGAPVLSILYQLSAGLPQNQFVGGHGFTGLLYFTHPTQGGDYQAFCAAVR